MEKFHLKCVRAGFLCYYKVEFPMKPSISENGKKQNKETIVINRWGKKFENSRAPKLLVIDSTAKKT